MLKVLIAAACVAAIGFVGYFFHGEFQKSRQESAEVAQAKLEECKQMLFAYQAFRHGKGGLPKMTGPETFQHKTARCADTVNQHFGTAYVVTDSGVQF